MKLLYVLLVASVTRASVIINAPGPLEVLRDDTRSIGAPTSITIIPQGPPLSTQVIWTPVPSPPANPIRGYMVKLWIQQTRIVESQELIDGEYVTVEREEPIPMPSNYSVPDWEPLEVITVSGSFNNMAHFHNLVTGRLYEYRIQAYTLTEFGPYTGAFRIQFSEPRTN